jgi:hypothetical protein
MLDATDPPQMLFLTISVIDDYHLLGDDTVWLL